VEKNASEEYSIVTITTLVFGELFEALGLVADTASELDGLTADTVPASGIGAAGESLRTLGDHGVAEHVNLSLGEGALHADLLADGAFDPGGVNSRFSGLEPDDSLVGDHDIVEPDGRQVSFGTAPRGATQHLLSADCVAVASRVGAPRRHID
jgi:hypothetical protein